MSEKKSLPRHVAITMDGNRRWAKAQGLDSCAGHRAGYETAKEITRHALDCGVEVVSLYALSLENLIKREYQELNFLFDLLREAFRDALDKLAEENVRLKFIGRVKSMDDDIYNMAREIEERTRSNTRGTVITTLGYGGRDDIVRAVREALARRPGSADISEADISESVDTADFPDPDLMIRTGKVQRLSGFLLWQCPYAELYFSQKLWPDFTTEDFDRALRWYAKQQRNFGR